ncbi:MAG: NACHT domain-containing protein [Mycobacterium leprae]
MDYAYEALGQAKFLQLCHALAARSFPDTALLPLGPEAGEVPSPEGGFMLVRAIFVAHPQAPDARSRLALSLESDLPEVRRRVSQGAGAFLLLTNVPGTTSMRSTAGDRVRKLLAPLPIPVDYWGRDALDSRLESALDLKLAYPELLTASPADTAPLQRRLTALRRFIEQQADRECHLPFAPPESPDDLLSLFVDLPAVITAPDSWESAQQEPQLVVKMLLDPEFIRAHPIIRVEGGPGQGKSTVLRAVCQLYRLRLLGREHDLLRCAGYRLSSSMLPMGVELRQLAAWLERRNPFAPDGPAPADWEATLESYLAALIRSAAGGPFTAGDLLTVSRECPLLLALDGLDEVAEPATRSLLMTALQSAFDRLTAQGVSVQLLIATRPSFYAKTALSGAPTLRLYPLDGERLIASRVEAGALSAESGDRLKAVLAQQPAIAELARIPLQAEILCHLVRQQVKEIPPRRTALFGAYTDSCLQRAIGSEADQPTSLDLHSLLAQHGLLAWQSQADSERDPTGDTVQPDPAQLDALQRTSLLAPAGDGRFRFTARSLREYLTARYLFDALPPDGKPDEAERFGVLAQNPYWLNVTRFYAGLAHRAYLPLLTTCLAATAQEEAHKGSSYPYLLSLLLLADQVFASQPKAQQSVVALCISGLRARRWLADEWLANELSLSTESGSRDLARAAMALLGELPPTDEAAQLVRLIRKHAIPTELAHWWRGRLWSAVGMELDRWVEEGRNLALLSGLTPDEVERLISTAAPERRQALTDLLRGAAAQPAQAAPDAQQATAALNQVLAGEPVWADALATLRTLYARGVTPARTGSPDRPLTQAIADAVLAEPGIYPLLLVRLAKEATHAQFGSKLSPVDDTVRSQGWFVQNKECLN